MSPFESRPPRTRAARVLWRALALCGVLGASVSCAQPGAAEPKDTLAQIKVLIGDAACSSDAQCRALPIGSRPCGGPESYLAWSTSMTDERALAALATTYERQRRIEHQKSGRLSTCEILPEPAVSCRPGEGGTPARCVLQPGRSGLVR